MRFIENEQWNAFLEKYFKYKCVKNEVAPNKGIQFEILVEDLLAHLFGMFDLTFHPTKASHDGSKDFWAMDSNDELWWAECKNYHPNIALKQLAPTLIMAELNSAQHLLFFSYSKLNENLKRHIGQYAYEHNKEVYIFEDDSLEALLFSCAKGLVLQFLGINKSDLDFKSGTEVLFFYEKNPKQIDRKNFNGFYEIEELAVGEVYNINVIAINKHLHKECSVNIVVEENPDNRFFDFLSEEKNNIYDVKKRTIHLKPNQIKLCKIRVRLKQYRENLSIPKLTAEVVIDKTAFPIKSPETKSYSCVWNRKDVFVGKQYEDMVRAFCENCISKVSITGFLVYGSGGTGKTRILEECSIVLEKHDYHVLNFVGFDVNSSWKDVIREITYHVFAISEDLGFNILCEVDDIVTPAVHTTIKSEIVTFLRMLNNRDFDSEQAQKYYRIIFGKLQQGRYAIVIDNMQSYSIEILDFFKKMIQFSFQYQKPCQLVLLFSINTALIFDNRFLNFIGEFERANFLCKEVVGFQSENQAITFLKTILKLEEYPLNFPILKKILSNTSLKPKYIEQLSNYLVETGCIEFRNKRGIIVKSSQLEKALKAIPSNFEKLFFATYQLILDKYPEYTTDFKNFISLLYLFSRIDDMLIDSLQINRNAVFILAKHSIIINEGDSSNRIYIFEHDLIEMCLNTDIYPDLMSTAIQYVTHYQHLYRTVLKDKKIQYILCGLYNESLPCETVIKINREKQNYSIPNKFLYTFYSFLLKNLILYQSEIPAADFISESSECCKFVRDHISEVEADSLFNLIYPHIFDITLDSKDVTKEHFSFVIHYCENKNRLNDPVNSLKAYRNYYNKLNSLCAAFPELKVECAYAQAYIDNRIFVCGKLEGDEKKYIRHLMNSIKVSIAMGFYDILFENYFDAANLYFIANGNSKKGLRLLECGFKSFNKLSLDTAAKFKVNYYSKDILYKLINREYTEALKQTLEAIQYLKDNDTINYHIFFKCRYLKYRVIGLLLSGRFSNILDNTFDEYEQTIKITNKTESSEWCFLQAKYAYFNNSPEIFSSIFQRYYAFVAASSSNITKNHRDVQMLEDLAVKFKLLFTKDIFSEIQERAEALCQINRILKMDSTEFQNFLFTYKSSAPIVSADGKDGYFV